MPTRTLLATTAITVFVFVFGCERGHEAGNAPGDPIERATILGAPLPEERTVDPAPITAPPTVKPEPAVRRPPADDVVETPESLPEPPPPGTAPGSPPSEYEDRCGRPLLV